MDEIDKKIEEIEKWFENHPRFQGAFSIEDFGINNAFGWLIDKLKKYREENRKLRDVLIQNSKLKENEK